MDIPDYLTREQLAKALKDSLAREGELKKELEESKGTIYSLEETITGLTSSHDQ